MMSGMFRRSITSRFRSASLVIAKRPSPVQFKPSSRIESPEKRRASVNGTSETVVLSLTEKRRGQSLPSYARPPEVKADITNAPKPQLPLRWLG